MASDAHAHPYDLMQLDPDSEKERLSLGVLCCASSWNEKEFIFQERLSREAALSGGPIMVLSFGAHPQLASADIEAAKKAVSFLRLFAVESRISAVGEIGFDFYDEAYRVSAEYQDVLFREQLSVARKYGLPCVLHLRRAMHKAFEYSKELAALPAVVLHSYSGTAREADSLVSRGVNAFFSFGTTVALNHKRAMDACSRISSDRLLIETDAPYQPLRGTERSSWRDLPFIADTIALLRAGAEKDCATGAAVIEAADRNFRRVYGVA